VALIPLTSLSPMDPKPTLMLPVLILHPSLSWDYLTSLLEDSFSPQTLAALHIPLREAQSPMNCNQEGQIQGGGWTFVYQPLTTQTSSSGKSYTVLHRKASDPD
jgi:hypothetical protein